jgi:hypothetical protein
MPAGRCPPVTTDERDGATEDIQAAYAETDGERRLTFERAAPGRGADAEAGDGGEAVSVVVAQPLAGYGMLTVRDGSGRELERYYGFDMALDHAAERLGVAPTSLPVPDGASDMGM